MLEQLARLRRSNQLLICKECKREFRGEETDQHTIETGHEHFYLKPVSIPEGGRIEI